MANPEGLTQSRVPSKDLFHDIVEEATRRAEEARRTTQTRKATPQVEDAKPKSVLSPREESANVHTVIDAALAKAQKRRTTTIPAVEIPPSNDPFQAAGGEEETAPFGPHSITTEGLPPVPEVAPVSLPEASNKGPSSFAAYAREKHFALSRDQIRQKLNKLKANHSPMTPGVA